MFHPVICKSSQIEIQIKPQRINNLSWKFDCSQYSFVPLPLKQGALINVENMTNKFENFRIKPSQLV